MRPTQNPKFPEGINASEENPLTEFFLLVLGVVATIVVVVVLLSVSAQWLAPKMPFHWEQSLVRGTGANQAFSELSSHKTAEHLQAELALQELGKKLMTARPASTDGITFAFHLLDESEPNAFATLGGNIFVTTGLIEVIDSENGLAMVLAHEIAHIEHRHPIQSVSRGVLLQLLLGLFGADTAAVQALTSQAGLLTLLSFNRDMERDADRDALWYLQSVYGHWQGADEFFSAMAEKHEQPQWQAAFQTHPGLTERLSPIKEKASLFRSMAVTPLDARLQSLKTEARD